MDTHLGEPDTYVQFSPETRKRIELAVEGLLVLLDWMDGDPDLEDGADDEYYLSGGNTDLESDNSDYEPWLATTPNQESTGLYGPDMGDDRERDLSDLEPSLAGTNAFVPWKLDCEHDGPIEGGQGL